jgi:acyl carrier protein
VDAHRAIREFIQDELQRPLEGVTDHDSLLEAGVLDSVAVLQVVGFVEQRFGIAVTEDEMLPDNFESIDAIAAFVQRRSSETRA